ncbi:MAG: hypothetical protein HN826_02095 [Methylococcales bacterium]|nr:hypothetical protein [Methylococcales bacterium]
MGKIIVSALLENFVTDTSYGEVDLLVDTGAALVGLTPDIIQKLQLIKTGERWSITTNGRVKRSIYSGLRISVMDRTVTLEVCDLPLGTPNLLGYIALELMDFIVIPNEQKLAANPDHQNEFLMDLC